jgi:hypothetical protein
MTIHCQLVTCSSQACLTGPIQSVSFLTGPLTPSNGLPNGSRFCKSLQTRNVYGVTAKFPPGKPLSRPTCLTSPIQSGPVKPSQTQSNQIQPPLPLPPLTHPFSGWLTIGKLKQLF